MRTIYSLIVVLILWINVSAQDQTSNTGNFQIYPGASLNCFGNFTNNGTVTDLVSAATFHKDLILNSGSTLTAGSSSLTIAGNWTNNGGTFTPGTGTITFNGTRAQSINGTAASQTFRDIIVSKSADSLLSVMGSTTTLITNNFTLTSGNFTAPFTMNIIATPASSLTLGSGIFTAGIIMSITGNWINNGGIFDPGSATVVFNGSAAQAINGTNASQSFNNVIISKTAGTTLSVGGSTTTLTVQDITETNGNFSPSAILNINGNRILTAGVFTAGATTYVTGNWTQNGGTFAPGSNSVVFNGDGAQSIKGTAVSQTFYNVLLDKSSGTLSTAGSTTTLTTNDFTATSGNFTAPATWNINGDLLLNSGTLTAGSTINVKGNWTNDGTTFIPGTNTVNFTGTGTKTLGGSSVHSFNKLTLNTVASTDILQLTSNITVTSVLDLTKGVFDLNSKSLSVTSGLAGAITRVNGYIMSEKTDNSSNIIWSIGSNLSSHTFPFGTASGSYIPFILDLTAGNIGNVTVSTYPTAYNNTPYPTTPVLVTNTYGSTGNDNSPNTVDRFWQSYKDGPTGTATITFTATNSEVGVLLFPSVQGYKSSTNKWQQPLPGQTNTATSATVPGVDIFSTWALSSQAGLLPIELVSFNADYTEPFVALTWVTESEINSDYFTIERTFDETNYETIVQVKAAGRSVQTLNYQSRDMHPLTGQSYYRLKQVDLDGSVSYSNLDAINIMAAEEHISISPNPVTDGMVTVKVRNHPGETVGVSVIDMNGKTLFESKQELGEDQQSSFVIDQLGDLAQGVYLFRIAGASGIFTEKIVIY